MPFFASFTDPGVSPGGGGESSVATVTTRLPLGSLLDSRDYIFTAATNVRGYEWTVRETDELFDDLMSAAVGVLKPRDGEGGGGDGGGGAAPTYDYELNQIVLVPLEWDTAMYGLGRRYGVYDGQQRLVTLCLLLAALRESFRNDGGGADSEGTVQELADMLNPPKVRKAPVLRIELRRRDDEYLRRILLPELTADGPGGSGVRVDLPLSGTHERKSLSATSRRVVDNYERLLERAGGMPHDERVRFLDYLVEHVYLLVCVPETARIARNIVMAQGKGMDNEPIDDFKGLVCFRYTRDEDEMYHTFDRWDALAAPPTDDINAGADVESSSVGRETIAAACLLRASAGLGQKIRKNDEVNALERWLRKDLIENEGDEGKDFFEREVEPASRALFLFREGDLDAFRSVVGGGGRVVRRKKKGGAADEKELIRRTTEARLKFLRGVISSTASAKEVEMVVLDLLLRAGGAVGRKKPTAADLDEYLRGAELAALWMALVKPPPSRRYEVCLDVLDAISAGGAEWSALESAALPHDDHSILRDKLESFEFGATPSGRKLASSLLERLNDHLLINYGDGMPEINAETRVEHVLPVKPAVKYWDNHWPGADDREELLHKLGNLVLLSRRATLREKNGTFAKKKERYKEEVWPLTISVSTCSEWKPNALMEQQGKLLGLMDNIWGL